MRKVFIDLRVRLVVNVEEGVDIADVVNEADYQFTATTTGATIEDSTIEDFEITDSK